MNRFLTAAMVCVLLLSGSTATAQPLADGSSGPKKALQPKVYDESADARTQITDALAAAKKSNRRVLIQWGGNWCPWCLRMNELMHADAEIARALESGYILIHVDCGRPAGKNLTLAKFYGTAVEQEGFPYLTVLDPDGKVIANQGTRGFELDAEKGHEESLKSGHDPAKLLKFLKDNKPAKPPVYDESADARTQISRALAAAGKNNRRVLIQWGGNWCPWCIRLHELMSSDKAIARELLYEYDVVHVDCGKPAGKNVDLAAGYKANVAKDGYPYLTILDADGKVLANQETSSLEVKNSSGESAGVSSGHDPAKVLKFLTDHNASPIAAQEILDKGLAEAKSSGKAVFVHFGAPWCVWCRRLEAWMARPEIASVLAKDFVDVKIDVDRNTGGNEMLSRQRASSEGGIPFIVFLDGAGKPLANANGPKGNIGFPGEPGEIEHFGAMLRKAAKNLTSKDIDALLASLKPEEAGSTPSH